METTTTDAVRATTLKRKVDDLTPPPVNDVQKRYLWSTEDLLTQNRFYLSANDEMQVSGEETGGSSQATTTAKGSINTMPSQSPTTTSSPKEKIPPIYLRNSVNYKELVTDIAQIVTGNFTTANTPNSLRINLSTADDYRALTKFYNQNSIEYVTFQDQNSKPLSVVIKNVPLSLTEDDIKAHLTSYPVIRVTRLLKKEQSGSKKPLPVCAVDLTNNDEAKAIFSLTNLYYSIVTVELRRKSTSIPQCHRCQRYGHTRNYCTLTPKCVKCAGDHSHSDCEKKTHRRPKVRQLRRKARCQLSRV